MKILLIEDNPGDARLIQEALAGLQDAEFELTCADRVSSGLEHLAKGNIDVILLDLNLPDSSGLDTFVRIYSHAPGIPVVILSGLQDEAVAVDAVQRGAQDYLSKAHVMLDSHFLVRSIRYAIERKRVQRELTRLASFPGRNPNPVLELDASGEISYLNSAAQRQFPTLTSGTSQHPLLRGLNAIKTTLRNGRKGVFIREIPLGKRVYEQHISYIPEGDLIRSYIVDITERKHVERLKQEFVSTVSHELRTPLATIKEFTGIMVDGLAGTTTPTQREYLHIIQSNVNRLTRIINDLLDMAKIDAGHVLLTKGYVEIRPLIEHVLQTMRPLAHGKQQQLNIKLPREGLGIFADRDRIIQILINLIGNAVKFTPESGHITIAVEDVENTVRFRVTDTGVGIAPQDLPKLFEKFHQLRQLPERRGTQGTGLGLSICKRLVELHGGRIWVESHVGSGTTFFFDIPKYLIEEVFKNYLDAGIKEAQKKQRSLSIAVISIAAFDRLKARCDQESLTRLLNEVEQLIGTTVRRRLNDIVVRWQRGEIIVILAEVDKLGASAIAQRLKRTLEEHRYAVGQTQEHIKVVIHPVTYPDEALTAEGLLRVAEGRLRDTSHQQPRILIVDDEAKFRRFLKETLESHGFEILSAASGPDALKMLETEPVNLILLDIIMPVMNGYQVYHFLKENPQTADTPVLIISAQGERPDRLLGVEHASDNYIAKPFQIEELLGKIQEIFQRA